MTYDRRTNWAVDELEAFLEPYLPDPGANTSNGEDYAGSTGFVVVPPGDVPEHLPRRLERMLREPGGDDRSKQLFAFVMTALAFGHTDSDIAALAECHRATTSKFGNGAAREARRVLAKHRGEHAHPGRWCKDVGCPNEPRWMADEPDTLARCSVGGEENSSKDMGAIIDVCDRIRVESGATVLLVHHARKLADAMRGSSAIEGACDTVIELKSEGQAITLVCGKQKDGRDFEPIRLWRAEVGDSCVIRSHEGRGTDDEPTVSEETLLRAAWDSCGTDGLPPSTLMEISGLGKSTYYRSQKALVTRGALVNVGTKNRPRYRPPEERPE